MPYKDREAARAASRKYQRILRKEHPERISRRNYDSWLRIKSDPLLLASYQEKRKARYKLKKIAWRKRQQVYDQQLNQMWYEGITPTGEIRRQAEDIAPEILLENGFTNIRRMSYLFPFDYVGIKEGAKYFIEITTARTKKLRKSLSSRSPHPIGRKRFTWRLDYDRAELAEFLGLKLAVLFVKPSLREYYLMLNPDPSPKHKTVRFNHAEIRGAIHSANVIQDIPVPECSLTQIQPDKNQI